MIRYAAAALVALAAPAAAEVIDTTPAGFIVSKTVTVAATPDAVWRALIVPSRWWSKDHTWSGEAANLSIVADAGGCFCEKLPGRGTVQHARVIYADRAKLLRMEGAFGPLQSMAVTGVMTFELAPSGDKATVLKMTYAVGGYMPGGLDKIAAPVDAVLGQQVDGLKAAAEASPAR